MTFTCIFIVLYTISITVRNVFGWQMVSYLYVNVKSLALFWVRTKRPQLDQFVTKVHLYFCENKSLSKSHAEQEWPVTMSMSVWKGRAKLILCDWTGYSESVCTRWHCHWSSLASCSAMQWTDKDFIQLFLTHKHISLCLSLLATQFLVFNDASCGYHIFSVF